MFICRSVGHQFNFGKASLFDAFVRIIKSLNDIASLVIKWPLQRDVQRIMDRFCSFAGLENVIGAIDGTFVPVKAPSQHPEVYITRKKNYAMTLQCIAEPSLKFTDCYIAYPGSVSDTRIFRNSDIYKIIHNNPNNFFNNNFILGDKAYPLLEWCIPPYIERRRLTLQQTHFNIVHAKTRQVIERSFALLFGRFRRLKFLDMNRTDLIPAVVIACCTLHNICLDHSDLLIDEYVREGHQFLMDFQDDRVMDEEDGEAYFPNAPLAARNRDNIALVLYNRHTN